MRQMRADLVGAAGDQLHFQQGQPSADGQCLVTGDDFLRAARRRVGNAHDAALGVLQQVIPQQGSGGIGAAKGHAEIPLFDLPLLDGPGQKCLSGVIFGQQYQAAGAGVQPVAQHGMGGLALGGQFGLHPLYQRVGVAAVHRQAGGLVGNDDVVILIHKHGGGGGAAFQLVVTQKQADGIAVLHPGGKRLLFAVQLDLVLPQGLVQSAQAQGRVLVHQILVQPHRQQAFYMQFFHWVVNS